MIGPDFLLRGLPRLLWVSALFILVTGYCVIDSHFQRAIDIATTESEQLYDQTIADERIVNESKRLQSLQIAVDRDLAQFKAQNYDISTQKLLEILQSDSDHFDTTVTAVEPVQSTRTAGNPADGLGGLGMTIRARGHFSGLLHFVEDLPRHHVLLSITDTDLQHAPPSDVAKEPLLDATIHGTVYTLQTATENHVAATR